MSGSDFINLKVCHLVEVKMLVPLLKLYSRDCKTASEYNIEMELEKTMKIYRRKRCSQSNYLCKFINWSAAYRVKTALSLLQVF